MKGLVLGPSLKPEGDGRQSVAEPFTETRSGGKSMKTVRSSSIAFSLRSL